MNFKYDIGDDVKLNADLVRSDRTIPAGTRGRVTGRSDATGEKLYRVKFRNDTLEYRWVEEALLDPA
jgi:hypothetical protein